jgi:hypothetical protein
MMVGAFVTRNGALLLSRMLAAWLSGVLSLDPLTLTASAAVLTTAAAASCYLRLGARPESSR